MTSAAVPTISLNNGVGIPQLGLGTARNSDEEIRRIVVQALDLGYRMIDTAAKYDTKSGSARASPMPAWTATRCS